VTQPIEKEATVMVSAVLLRQTGGPEVLHVESVPLAAPAPSEILVRQTAIGVNFHDCYVRSGLYQTLPLPGIPGIEAVGVVEAVGSGVPDIAVGDRVGYVTNAYGGYAEARVIGAERVIRLPDELDDRTAAGVLLKGLTTWMLLNAVRTLEPGETCLVHAAAGGVGRLLCQWASHLGALVIGTAGSREKADIALRNGCTHVILYREEDFAARVRELTDGRGVDVVYDSVGRDTFSGSLRSLAVRGHLVNFGQSSGPVEPFTVSRLAEKSNTLSRPLLFHYIESPAERAEMAARLFEMLRTGLLRVEIGAEFPLREAARAHRAIESRSVSGSIILVP
jgi:NADPH2:quinone reductase